MQAVNLCLLTSSAAERHAGRSRLLAVTQNLPYLPNLHVRGRKKNHQNVETSDKDFLPVPASFPLKLAISLSGDNFNPHRWLT
ncbi:hypothetical protein AV530_004334 [Patagioenas fasciata monilis]|uniref:Uncharacterized protein n=1 Tax=Patagioenas fasciata monilis TaxID=372326 RepID=A0A1V4K988_PATFA|nr:hypothetical protein AV530_004334 [Patagioenas fasciata monilis]